jgi:uridine phosphorylase
MVPPPLGSTHEPVRCRYIPGVPYLTAAAADLQRLHRVADADLPDAAVLYGVWSTGSFETEMGSLFPDARPAAERTILVERDGRKIWVIHVFGAAMAASHAHLAAVLGARSILQVGSYGGLATTGSVGDVLVPTRVLGKDGVSRQQSKGVPIEMDTELRDRLQSALAAAGATTIDGLLISTTTISLERDSDVRRWVRAGYAGVEMEAAATAAMARHFGIPTAGAFVLWDNIGVGHTIFTRTDEDRERTRVAQEQILLAAVETVATFG